MYFYLCIFLSCIVLSLAGVILWLLKRKPQKQKPELDVTASELLSKLMAGGAVVVTQILDPSELFLWSSKDVK